MPSRSDRSTDPTDSWGRRRGNFLWKLGFASVLAFMVGGLIGGVTRVNAPVEHAFALLWANGRPYGLLFLTLVTCAVGFSLGRLARERR